MDNPPPEVGSLWGEGLLPKKGLTMIHSASKQGKSMLTLNLALAGACGWPEFLGHKLVAPFTTLIFQGEIHQRGVFDRASKMLEVLARANNIPPEITNRIVVNESRGHKLSNPLAFYEFQEFIRWMQPGAVFIDPFAHCLTEDENNNALVGRMLEKLEGLRDVAESAIVFVHHDSKGNESNNFRSPRQRSRGADRLNADPDAILSLVPCGQNPGQGPKSKVCIAGRYCPTVEPFTIMLNEKTFWFEQVFGERGDLKMLVKWVSEMTGGTGVMEMDLLKRISTEWGYEDGGRHREARKYVMRAVKKNLLIELQAAGVKEYDVPQPGEGDDDDD